MYSSTFFFDVYRRGLQSGLKKMLIHLYLMGVVGQDTHEERQEVVDDML